MQTASGDKMDVEAIGDLSLTVLDREIVVKDVYVVPRCRDNLVSASQLLRSDRNIAIITTRAGMMAAPLNQKLLEILREGTVLARPQGGAYVVTESTLRAVSLAMSISEVGETSPSCSSDLSNDPLLPDNTVTKAKLRGIWAEYHVRLGHMSLLGFKEILLRDLKNKNMVSNLLNMKNDCVTCTVAKMSYSKPSSTLRPADCLMQRVHADIVYLASTDIEKCGYCTLVIEEYSRYKVCIITKTMGADDVGVKLIALLKSWSNLHNRPLQEFRSDGGGQFLNAQVLKYFESVGAVSKPSPAYVQALNGLAEGNVRPMKDMARCLCLTAHFGAEMQSYAIRYAVNISNLPIHPFTKKSPFEQWHHRVPDISVYKPFGCLAVVHEPKALRDKLGCKGALGLFLGLCGTDLYYIFLFETQKIHSEKVVKFFPNRFPGLRRVNLQYRPLYDPLEIGIRRPTMADIQSQRRVLEEALDAAERKAEVREGKRWQNSGELSASQNSGEPSVMGTTSSALEVNEADSESLRERDITEHQSDGESKDIPRKRARFEDVEPALENITPDDMDSHLAHESNIETTEEQPVSESQVTPTEADIGESTVDTQTAPDPDVFSPSVPDLDIRTMRNGRWRAVPVANFIDSPERFIPEQIEIDDYTEEVGYQPKLLRLAADDKTSQLDMSNLWNFKGPGVLPLRSDIRVVDVPAEPNNMAELWRHKFRDHWISAMQAEMGSIKGMNAMVEVDMPDDRKAVPLTWKFKYKTKGEFIARFKARICVRGDLQKAGVDYDPEKTYSPVMKGISLRVTMALCGPDGKMYITAGDITTAFLNATPEKDVFVLEAPGFPLLNPKKKLKLLRSLYGLCQSPKEWYDCLRNWLNKNGYLQSKTDPCLFTKKGSDGKLEIILVYVDDMLIMASTRAAAEEMKNMLRSKFTMTDVEDADKVIGVEIFRVKGGICLGQPTYAKTVLEKSGFWDVDASKAPKNPMSESWAHDEKSGDLPKKEKDFFVSYLMMLAWMSQQTRLDLCAATSILAQFLSKPTKSDLGALRWLLFYLRGSYDDVLFYRDEKAGVMGAAIDYDIAFHSKDNPPGFLVGYSDASFGGEPGRKSRTGCIVLARGAAVDWMSKKQSMVALSSTEAEYLSLSQMTQMMAGLRSTMLDLGETETVRKPSRIYEDNKSCIAIAYKPMHQGRTKHFDIKAHFIRDRIERGEVEVVYCPTEEMVADMLTKALPAKQHQRLKRFAGLYPLSELQIVKLNDVRL